MTGREFRRQVVIGGVGYSQLGRDTGRTEGELTVDAIRGALDDAGITADQVDGVAPWPDRVDGDSFAGPRLSTIQRSFGLRLRYWQSGGDGPGQVSGIQNGAYAIAAGAANVVLVWRTVIAQPRRKKIASRPVNPPVWHEAQFVATHGVGAMAPKWALLAQRFMHETGAGPDALCSVVLNNRHNAQYNPRAVWHGSPLEADDYFASPMIASPLRLLDCDMPVDASVAVVLARADRAPDLRHRPAFIEAITGSPGSQIDPDLRDDLTKDLIHHNASQLWERTDLRPTDIDVAELYDGFSFQTLMWLEALGFCGRGEAGAFVAEGHTRLGGSLPVCTDGGQLGSGRYHGLEKVALAARQVWHGADGMQVKGAEVAVAALGSGSRGGTVLLTGG